jgi:hypothetical protein
VLATALTADGKNSDALKEIDKVSSIAAKSQNLAVQLAFAIANANAESASHQDAEAKTLLKQASLKATKSAYLGYQFQCRLAMEAIGLKSGKSTESRARLERFQKEATEKGFDLMARKASALLAN